MGTRSIKFTALLFLVLLSCQSLSFAVSSIVKKNIPITYREIQVVVDGKAISGEEPFIMDNTGIVMVPVRMVAEAVGKSVIWDESKNIIYIGTATYIEKKATSAGVTALKPSQGKIIPVTYRGIQIFAGGKFINSEEPFILDEKGIVMVPIRAVAEATGKSVVWNSKNNIIEINTGKSPVIPPKADEFVKLEDMMVIRNIGPFFHQGTKPYTIAAGTHNSGLGVRLRGGSAELVIRTHGKYKAIEGWLGVDDETSNTSGAFFMSIFTDSREVLSDVEVEGGAEKIINRTPNEYGYDYNLVQIVNPNKDAGVEGEKDSIYKNTYPVNSDLYEKTPIYICGPILPASYPKYINPASTNISGALTVTIRVTWVAGEQGDYSDLTAVLAGFKFIK